MTKNITLSVDEELLRKAKIVAAQKGTSVNALVRGFLEELASRDERAEQARRRLLELADQSEADMGPNYKWNRAALYDD